MFVPMHLDSCTELPPAKSSILGEAWFERVDGDSGQNQSHHRTLHVILDAFAKKSVAFGAAMSLVENKHYLSTFPVELILPKTTCTVISVKFSIQHKAGLKLLG